MMMDKNSKTRVVLMIFTRYPVPGKAKTRLIPQLGAAAAADLQKQMTEYTLAQALGTGCPVQICYTGGSVEQMRQWLGPQHIYVEQGEGDLGERLKAAFSQAFARQADKVLVLGCDCPDNRTANIADAIRRLDTTSCVLGPAVDGGYYLLGLNRFNPDLFHDIDWGTASVLSQTLERVNDYQLLPVLADVDEVEDIPSKISVIIPTLNEEVQIEGAVRRALTGFGREVIVVDGGSSDATREAASAAGARIICSRPGRATQMNAGAQQARGDILLFLHADARLPDAWDRQIRQVIRQPEVVLGYFPFAVDADFTGRRWVEWGTNVRSRLFKRPYGDQGFFLRRQDFEAIGGFPEVPILEDLLLVKQARQRGGLACTGTPLTVSSRRWQKHGAFRTTGINQLILFSAWCGADLDRLHRAYRQGGNPLRCLFEKRSTSSRR